MVDKLREVPVIGHNPMYDILYFYNQFIDVLPETYLEFAQAWKWVFRQFYDSKVYAFSNKEVFKKSVLGDIFELSESDIRFKGIVPFKFDEKHNMTKYMPVSKPEPPKEKKEEGALVQNGGSQKNS